MAQDFEFRSFLLQLSKDMASTDFEQLKYLLKGYVSSAKCEEITEVCKYFGELERMCLLTPTNFGVLKKALGAIGRQDLVEKIEQKENTLPTCSGKVMAITWHRKNTMQFVMSLQSSRTIRCFSPQWTQHS
ncbi:hypothetical protein OS493_026723 [Desmophyllum pertusum]|uniref:DED domain-containing protein n=1 Tax=Desmophyllum pertusum TaxID=174260 RepID=A0A9W9ZYI9_9CNID|nr:hypothetical protein OS493_026723 [Desmophyllum pertusum]